MNKAKLLDLADRVEALQGPCAETDRAIKQIMGHGWDYGADWDRWDALKGEKTCEPVAKPYTRSLDSAMSLVPEGCDFMVDNFDGRLVGFRCSAGVFSCGQWVDCNNAATPALALTAACLRARAQAEEA